MIETIFACDSAQGGVGGRRHPHQKGFFAGRRAAWAPADLALSFHAADHIPQVILVRAFLISTIQIAAFFLNLINREWWNFNAGRSGIGMGIDDIDKQERLSFRSAVKSYDLRQNTQRFDFPSPENCAILKEPPPY
jgi:hypothetical protein